MDPHTPQGSAPSAPLRVAVVGTGNIARFHAEALEAEPERARIVSAVDVSTQALDTFRERFTVPSVYTDLSEMLAAERPDLVHVCTPPGQHQPQVEACLGAGSSVLVEKPPALSLAETEKMAEAEGGDRGPWMATVFQHRFGSGALRVADMISSGVLGRPLIATCHTTWFRAQEYFDVPWRGRWETEGGGPSMGHGIHQMDLALSLLGDWTEVTAVMATTTRDIETEDVSAAIVRCASGATISVTNSLLSPRETSYLRFDLEHATVELEHLYGYDNAHWRWTPAPHIEDPDAMIAWQPEEDVPSSHKAQLIALLDAMERGERPRVSGDDGRIALELITGMYRSALLGRTVRRHELTPDDAFYHSVHGGDGEAATALLARGETDARV